MRFFLAAFLFFGCAASDIQEFDTLEHEIFFGDVHVQQPQPEILIQDPCYMGEINACETICYINRKLKEMKFWGFLEFSKDACYFYIENEEDNSGT